jgi:hypothetical protein
MSRRARAEGQLGLPGISAPLPFELCPHESGFETSACVPVGVVCNECGVLLSQYLPQGPEVLGYVSADWAWHHEQGEAWVSWEGTGEPLAELRNPRCGTGGGGE